MPQRHATGKKDAFAYSLAMIASISGELSDAREGQITLRSGPFCFELLVPAADQVVLEGMIGQELTFYTLFYLEGDATRGNLEPRLIGFLRADDKLFFNRFTTVKGIGPRTALRALQVPVGQIAQAIESKDARALTQLKGIGKRTAELIVAELSGKMGRFVSGAKMPAPASSSGMRYPAMEEEAIVALMSLGDRRADAERLLERAKTLDPAPSGTDMLVREMLRIRTGTRG